MSDISKLKINMVVTHAMAQIVRQSLAKLRRVLSIVHGAIGRIGEIAACLVAPAVIIGSGVFPSTANMEEILARAQTWRRRRVRSKSAPCLVKLAIGVMSVSVANVVEEGKCSRFVRCSRILRMAVTLAHLLSSMLSVTLIFAQLIARCPSGQTTDRAAYHVAVAK